jgi:hypothetical protein
MPSITRKVCAQVICSSSQHVRRPTKATNGNDQPNSADYWWQLWQLLSILICVASVIFCGLNCIILDCSISCPSNTKHRSIPLGFLPKGEKKKTKMANHPHCSSTAYSQPIAMSNITGAQSIRCCQRSYLFTMNGDKRLQLWAPE